jgi:hypothetical protein
MDTLMTCFDLNFFSIDKDLHQLSKNELIEEVKKELAFMNTGIAPISKPRHDEETLRDWRMFSNSRSLVIPNTTNH